MRRKPNGHLCAQMGLCFIQTNKQTCSGQVQSTDRERREVGFGDLQRSPKDRRRDPDDVIRVGDGHVFSQKCQRLINATESNIFPKLKLKLINFVPIRSIVSKVAHFRPLFPFCLFFLLQTSLSSI